MDGLCQGTDFCANVTCPSPPECRLPAVCQSGVCLDFGVSADNTMCRDTDNNPCTFATCEGGVCTQNNFVNDGTTCDDGFEETDMDRCEAGA